MITPPPPPCVNALFPLIKFIFFAVNTTALYILLCEFRLILHST